MTGASLALLSIGLSFVAANIDAVFPSIMVGLFGIFVGWLAVTIPFKRY